MRDVEIAHGGNSHLVPYHAPEKRLIQGETYLIWSLMDGDGSPQTPIGRRDPQTHDRSSVATFLVRLLN